MWILHLRYRSPNLDIVFLLPNFSFVPYCPLMILIHMDGSVCEIQVWLMQLGSTSQTMDLQQEPFPTPDSWMGRLSVSFGCRRHQMFAWPSDSFRHLQTQGCLSSGYMQCVHSIHYQKSLFSKGCVTFNCQFNRQKWHLFGSHFLLTVCEGNSFPELVAMFAEENIYRDTCANTRKNEYICIIWSRLK